jgi:hypothetical protein
MRKNLRSIVFAGAISMVGTLGIAGVVAGPVASAGAVPPSHTAPPPPPPTVTVVSTSTTTTSTIDHGFDVLRLVQW